MPTLERIAVEDLTKGLYVSELDRPWLESPFLFQGFLIESDQDLQKLRECCQHVFIDPQRCDPQALQQARSGSRPAAPAVQDSGAGAANRSRELQHLFGNDPYPSPRLFRAELQRAAEVRRQTRHVVDDLMRQIRAGATVDSGQARGVVRYLVRAITRNATASLWLNNLKSRDEYTAIHCMNVCVLALAFGRFLGMERSELELLGLGALLHDIGKMRTPDAVLNKPGPLTAEEFAIMRRHPVDGYEAVRADGDVPAPALDIILHHHERVSGRGYPDGLAGEDIPLGARVAAIADVYDAMTSDRVYKRAMSPDKAIGALYQSAADDFGRELVEAFIRCIGIYPVGSLVELDSGALGVVISSLPQSRLKPVLLMVRTPEGEAYGKRLIINLAAMDAAGQKAAPTVRRVVDPEQAGVDIVGLTRAELDQVGSPDV